MISQSLIDRVEELKRTTYSNITEMQKNLCPMIKDVILIINLNIGMMDIDIIFGKMICMFMRVTNCHGVMIMK